MPQPATAKTTFGAVVAAKIADSGRTVKEVAARLKATPASQFTKWKKGLWTSIEPDKLVAVAEAITDDPREQADIIMAYLHDMTPLKFRPSIEFMQKGEHPFAPSDGKAPWVNEPEARRLAAIVEAYPLDRDFAAMTDQLLAWAKRLKAERSAQQGK